MPRYKKQQIELDKESLAKQLNEIHHQSSETRAKCIALINILRSGVQENITEKDWAALNVTCKALVDLIKVEQSSIDKKLSIARVVKDYLSADGKKSEGDESTPQGGGMDKNSIAQMLKEMNREKRGN